MIIRSFAPLALAASVLTGCVVGPDYVAPEIGEDIVFSDYADKDPALIAAGLDIRADWWESFGDAHLNALVEKAIAANPDIRAATARLAEARALGETARGARSPSISADSLSGRSRNSAETLTMPGAPLEQSLYSAGVSAAWELDVFGRIQRSVELADAQIAVNEEDRRAIMLLIISDVALNYADLRSLQHQQTVAERNEAIAKKTVDLTELLESRELATEFDIVRARADLTEIIASQSTLIAGQRAAAARIAVLTGVPPATLMSELIESASEPLASQKIPIGLASDLVRRRPDIRAAERNYAAATARIGVETADLFPRFSLTGALTTAATSVDQLFASSSEAWSYAGIVQWSVFDGGRQRAQIDAAEAGMQAPRAVYDKTILEALRDVEAALAAYVYTTKELEILRKAREDRARALELANLRYQTGIDDFFSVLETQRRLTGLDTQIATAQANQLAATVGVYRALGGGWKGL